VAPGDLVHLVPFTLSTMASPLHGTVSDLPGASHPAGNPGRRRRRLLRLSCRVARLLRAQGCLVAWSRREDEWYEGPSGGAAPGNRAAAVSAEVRPGIGGADMGLPGGGPSARAELSGDDLNRDRLPMALRMQHRRSGSSWP